MNMQESKRSKLSSNPYAGMQFAGELDMMQDFSFPDLRNIPTTMAPAPDFAKTSFYQEFSRPPPGAASISHPPQPIAQDKPNTSYTHSRRFNTLVRTSDDFSAAAFFANARDSEIGKWRANAKNVTYAAKANYPKRHKAKVVVWADLSVDAVDRLNESLNADHIKQVLADIFMLDNYKENVKTGIIMDLYFYTLQFAKEQNFSAEKTSTFFSIIKKIFEVCIETPFGNLDHTFEYFKDLILCHSVNRPPHSIELFTPNEVRKITEYTINTFFRHFKMYKYAFTPMVTLDLCLGYVGMPPSPPPTEADFQMETPGDDENQADAERETEEPDPERLKAQEELRAMVRDFLTSESKKIEGNVDHHIKAAVDALNAKLDPLIGSEAKEAKGKKGK